MGGATAQEYRNPAVAERSSRLGKYLASVETDACSNGDRTTEDAAYRGRLVRTDSTGWPSLTPTGRLVLDALRAEGAHHG